jgi:hypothetical protein
MQKWQYYTHVQSLNEKFLKSSEWGPSPDWNRLGQDGWELVNVIAASHTRGEADAGRATSFYYYFKRPIE